MKGISTKVRRDGVTIYRIDTFINGKKTRSPWSVSLDDMKKELEKLLVFRVVTPRKNQHTNIDNDITVGELIGLFKIDSKNSYGEGTWHGKFLTLYRIFSNFISLKCGSICGVEDQIIDEMRGRAISRASATFYLSNIKTLLDFAKENGHTFTLKTSRMKKQIRQFPAQVEKTKFMTKDEVAQFFKFLDGRFNKRKSQGIEGKACTLFKRAVRLALYNGLRIGEIMALRYNCADLNKGKMLVKSTTTSQTRKSIPKSYKQGTKTGPTRLIDLSDKCLADMKDMKEENPTAKPTDLIFPYTRGWAQGYLDIAHEEGALSREYTFHSFRHTFASLWIMTKGKDVSDLLSLQKIMGHADWDQTLDYVHQYESSNGRNLIGDLSFTKGQALEGHRDEQEATENSAALTKLIDVKKKEGKLVVRFPFQEQTNAEIQALGALWMRAEKYWSIAVEKEFQVTEILMRYFPEYKAQAERLAELRREIAEIEGLA